MQQIDLITLMQLVSTMEDATNRLEEAVTKQDLEAIKRIKLEIMKFQEEIEKLSR